MTQGGVALEGLDCLPRLAEGCDPTTLKITPAEGFLFSRIDGQTSWRLLQQIGGLPASEVDRCLDDWIASGLVEVDGTPPRTASAACAPAPPGDPWEIDVEFDVSQIDESLDLDVEVQRRILVMDATLTRPDHEILGVAPDASLRQVKRSYFKLSREFHPDRYFRRSIAANDERLHRIFKRVLQAYEVMSDPARRSVPPREDVAAEAEPSAAPARPSPKARIIERAQRSRATEPPPRPAPVEQSRLERLKARMPFKLPEDMASERRQKSSALYCEAQDAAARGHYDEALKTMKLAVAFDPFNRDNKRLLAECQTAITSREVASMLASPSGPNPSEGRDALAKLEDASAKCTFDCPTRDLTARLALALGDLDVAIRFIRGAVESEPANGALQRTLGKVLLEQGEQEAAVEALKLALDLDANDNEARRLLASLTKRSQRK